MNVMDGFQLSWAQVVLSETSCKRPSALWMWGVTLLFDYQFVHACIRVFLGWKQN